MILFETIGEASIWARLAKSKIVTANYIEKALKEQKERVKKFDEWYTQMIIMSLPLEDPIRKIDVMGRIYSVKLFETSKKTLKIINKNPMILILFSFNFKFIFFTFYSISTALPDIVIISSNPCKPPISL